MTTFLVHTSTTAAGRPLVTPTLPSTESRSTTKKNHRGTLAASLLVAIGCTALWSATIGTAGLDGPAPAVRLAGVVTSIDAPGAPHVRALSGPDVPLEPVLTAGQRNAVRSAKAYLDLSAFSRTGLIKQLEYEGFSTADATFAVDQIAVDWNAQAAKSAKAYLDLSGFSRSGLIGQLQYEGFTPAQAAYGATAAGL